MSRHSSQRSPKFASWEAGISTLSAKYCCQARACRFDPPRQAPTICHLKSTKADTRGSLNDVTWYPSSSHIGENGCNIAHVLRLPGGMSDSFEMLVDIDVRLRDADVVSQTVVDRLRASGLIVGEATEDCVLGGVGYKPCQLISALYTPTSLEHAFWELRTCGVQLKVRRQFNFSAFGPAFESLTCSGCGTKTPEPDDSFMDAFGNALSEWIEEKGEGMVTCPTCDTSYAVTAWIFSPPLGFGNLSLTFWNWPPLHSSSWRIDIIGLVQETTGHRIVHTYGRI